MASFVTKTIDEVTETLIDYRGKTPPKSSDGGTLAVENRAARRGCEARLRLPV